MILTYRKLVANQAGDIILTLPTAFISAIPWAMMHRSRAFVLPARNVAHSLPHIQELSGLIGVADEHPGHETGKGSRVIPK